jgi:hypothetical protein
MKKEYKKPTVQSSEKAENWAPLGVAAAQVAGFAVGRAIANAIKIDSLQKVSSLLPVLTEEK